MKATFVLRQDEYFEAQRADLRSLPWAVRLVAWIPCALMLVGIAISVAAIHNDPESPQAVVAFVLLIWVNLLFVSWVLTNRYFRRAEYRKRFAGLETSVVIDDSFFEVTSSKGVRSRLEWRALDAMVETPQVFMLLQDRFWFYPIPKRAISAPEIEELRSLLKAKLNANGTRG